MHERALKPMLLVTKSNGGDLRRGVERVGPRFVWAVVQLNATHGVHSAAAGTSLALQHCNLLKVSYTADQRAVIVEGGVKIHPHRTNLPVMKRCE